MLNPIKKIFRSISERGVKGMIIQLYTVGDLKFGSLIGTDKFGNKYYEDNELPYGQHRWVEYADIHNFDASMIQPEWHGWMHHMYDEAPGQEPAYDYRYNSTERHAIYDHHVGYTELPATAMINKSTFRQRGYKVGSLYTGPNDPDEYYMQPGHPFHPLVDKGGRFQHRKDMVEAIHDDEARQKQLENEAK